MGNKIFRAILNEKINEFITDYTRISKDIFLNDSGKLIHPR